MFWTDLSRELRRRRRQAAAVALSMALGIGLGSMSSGIARARAQLLHALNGAAPTSPSPRARPRAGAAPRCPVQLPRVPASPPVVGAADPRQAR